LGPTGTLDASGRDIRGRAERSEAELGQYAEDVAQFEKAEGGRLLADLERIKRASGTAPSIAPSRRSKTSTMT
jgi:hypothetical protein